MIAKTRPRKKDETQPGLVPELRDRSFKISHLRILDEHGQVDTKREPPLGTEDLIHLYGSMVTARAVDDRMLKMQRQGRIGTFALCTGQEAVSCGSALAMTDKDWFVGAFRELGGRLMRGEPIENCLFFYNGYEEGNVFPGRGRTLPISIIVGAQTLHAVGIAHAMKLRGETDSAVVCYFGDGATSEGDFHEAMNFASIWQAPVVFICANNQWAISVPREKQTNSRTLAQKAIAYDIPGIQVDGNDALAMYQATKDALDRAHAGEGPTFIEAVTYRLMMHTTADDPTRYQPPELLEAWQARDPIPRFRGYLQAKGLWDEEKQGRLEEEVKGRIEDALEVFESRKDFKPDSPFDYIYGTTHARIEEQRTEFLDNLQKESVDA